MSFDSDLLDCHDELMQNDKMPVSESNPLAIIKSSPRPDGIKFLYTVILIPQSVDVCDLEMGGIWILVREGEGINDDDHIGQEDYGFSL